MEHPRLNLGIVGFTMAQRKSLADQLLTTSRGSGFEPASHSTQSPEEQAHHPDWQLSDYREADALMLNAARSHVGADRILRFMSDTEHPSPVGVSLSELSVPFAVAQIEALTTALGSINELQVHAVDLTDNRSVTYALHYFEAALRPLRALFNFACHMMERRPELDTKHTYHLMHKGALNVLLDLPQRRIWVRDSLHPHEIQDCAWESRPQPANSAPPGFTMWTLEEVAWIFARHCTHPRLPARYREQAIYFRRLPRVRPSLLYPRQLQTLEHISLRPWYLDDLAALPQFSHRLLERDLYALYLCRAITTDPRKAPNGKRHFDQSSLPFPTSSTLSGNSTHNASLETPGLGLPTSPSRLA
jgi:hypothetical protein